MNNDGHAAADAVRDASVDGTGTSGVNGSYQLAPVFFCGPAASWAALASPSERLASTPGGK
jgi:hypothetical protein